LVPEEGIEPPTKGL